jgi:predicted Zn-dependent peptidase
MLFKGTSAHSARELARHMDSVGAVFNAYTSRERTCFYGNALSRHIPMVIDTLREMYYDSIFSAKEIAREKEVILQELLMCEDSPDEVIHDRFLAQLWPDHSIGFTVTGTEKNIRAMRRDSLIRFFKDHYVTDRLVVSVAGAINPEEIQNAFALWSERKSPGDHSIPPVPPIAYTIRSQQKPLEQTHLLLAMPGISKTHPRRYAMSLLNQIWGGSMSSRLFQRLREDKGICYSIYTFPAMMRETGLFGIYCASSHDNLEKVLRFIFRENALLLSKGVTPEELACAKEQLRSSWFFGRESAESRMNTNASHELIFGRDIPAREILAEIDKVGLDDTRAVIDHILGGHICAARTLGPKSALPVLERFFPGSPHAKE